MADYYTQRLISKFYLCFGITCLNLNQSHANTSPPEIRFGVMKNDIHGSHLNFRHEKGCNINGELLFTAFTGGLWDYIFNPKLHVGWNLNIRGYTSHLYTGLTWFIRLNSFVIEPTFGFDLNNAERQKKHQKRQRLGSPITFRESLSLGYKVNDNWTGYVMIDHVSHAHIFHPNPGLSTIGIRIGYQF